MAGITQTIPQYSAGISEQPDHLKFPGQVTDVVNAIPDVTKGLFKRPGSKRIGTDALSSVQSGGSWFHYFRDETEGSYIGQVAADGQVRVWRCTDGQLMTTSYTHNGVNQYVYGTHITDGSTVTMSLNATAIQGEPTMSIHMYNPDNINQYWDAGAPSQPITLGENVLPWGPHGRVYIRFMIELDAGESVTFSSFSALDSNDDPNAIPDPDNGI